MAAGVPCQNSVADERGVAGQQDGIPMSEMQQYIQDVLDLVEWANGDLHNYSVSDEEIQQFLKDVPKVD